MKILKKGLQIVVPILGTGVTIFILSPKVQALSLSNLSSSLTNAVSSTTSAVTNAVSGTTSAVTNAVSGTTSAVTNAVSGTTSAVTNAVSGTTSAVTNAVSGTTTTSSTGTSSSSSTSSIVGGAPVQTAYTSTSITPGSLTVIAPSSIDLAGIMLNGQIQSLAGSPGEIAVVDATGTGDGWHVTVSANPMTEVAPSEGFASGTVAKTLPTGSLELLPPTSITAYPGSSPLSTLSIQGGPWIIDNGQGTSTTIMSAAEQGGMGTYLVNFPQNSLQLNLSPNTTFTDPINYPNASTPYQTTVTWTIASGP